MEDKNVEKFLEWMTEEDTPFSKVESELGKFGALLFFLNSYEKWLASRDSRILSAVPSEKFIFTELDNGVKCSHLCNGTFYKDSPCGRIAYVEMNGRPLCTLHIGIEVYADLGFKRETTWRSAKRGIAG